MKNQQEFYSFLIAGLDEGEKGTLSKNFETAQAQYIEYLKVKAEDAAKKQ